jgi:uncharacterized membrane protein YhaH (DUF805 family)
LVWSDRQGSWQPAGNIPGLVKGNGKLHAAPIRPSSAIKARTPSRNVGPGLDSRATSSPRPTSAAVPSSAQNAPTAVLQHLFSFHGRMGRGIWWMWCVALVVIETTLKILGEVYGPLFELSLMLPLGWIGLVHSVKRCHDVDRPGWWLLVPFASMGIAFEPGTRGPNKYGPDPRIALLPSLDVAPIPGHLVLRGPSEQEQRFAKAAVVIVCVLPIGLALVAIWFR